MTTDPSPAVAVLADATGSGMTPAPLPAATGLRRVLVASDFSRGAALSLRRVSWLPLATDATIEIVHVISDRVPAASRAPYAEAARRRLAEAGEALDRFAAAAGRSPLTAQTTLLTGNPIVEIIRHGRAVGADLLVLGRHGCSGLREYLLGTTAERVVRASDRPVLVVGRRASRPYARPVVAVDPSAGSRHLLELALRVVSPAVTLTAVRAYEVPFLGFLSPTMSAEERARYLKDLHAPAAAELELFLRPHRERVKPVLRRGDPRGVILAELARRRADLVVLGSHGRSGLTYFLLGNVAETVLRSAPCDVLLTRSPGITVVEPR